MVKMYEIHKNILSANYIITTEVIVQAITIHRINEASDMLPSV